MGPSASNPAWSDGPGFGIPELDAADRQLIALAQVLNQAIADGLNRGEILRLINQLVLEAVRHFELEERVLSECSYPTAKGHAALHLQMKAEIEHATKELADAGAHAMWAEYGLLITQIIVDHFRQETMKYREFLGSGPHLDSQARQSDRSA